MAAFNNHYAIICDIFDNFWFTVTSIVTLKGGQIIPPKSYNKNNNNKG